MSEQATLWNGSAGRAWVDSQALIDRIFKPLEDALVEGVAAGARVLDVGCGTGSATVAAAKRSGHAVGVDISVPMIEAARSRAAREGAPATFVVADAQTHAFEPATYDVILSRMGVMFFDDPVQAFANLRRAAQDRLRFIAWRGPEENPFMTTAERAAAPLLPDLPPRKPDAPGQFGFADPERVRGILEAAGWSDVVLAPVDFPCALPEPALAEYAARFGPVGRVLGEADEATRNEVGAVVRAAFEPFVHGDEVRFVSACWQVDARAR